jgi:hypothetical protein
MARHYMHQIEIKKQRFIKNKVMVQFVMISIDKVSGIPATNVIPPTFERDDGDNLCRV